MRIIVLSVELTRQEEVSGLDRVITSAVILPKDCEILYLNDSKNYLLQREKSCMMRLWRKRLQRQ